MSRHTLIHSARALALAITACHVLTICAADENSLQDVSEQQTLNIYWTDRGVNQWQGDQFIYGVDPGNPTTTIRTKITGVRGIDDFSRTGGPVIPGISQLGQIPVRMPADAEIPTTEEGWQRLTDEIYESVKKRIAAAIRQGVTDIEVQQLENIRLVGHLADTVLKESDARQRQANVERFTLVVSKALSKIKREYARNRPVKLNAVAGSNGARTIVNVLPDMDRNLIDKLVLDSSRGGLIQTNRAIDIVGPRNTTVILSRGDTPAPPGTIANHQAAEWLKKSHPELKVYKVDRVGGTSFYPPTNHIETMKSDTPDLWVREFTGSGYSDERLMSRGELLSKSMSKPQTPFVPGSPRGDNSPTSSSKKVVERLPGSTPNNTGSNGGVSLPLRSNPDESSDRYTVNDSGTYKLQRARQEVQRHLSNGSRQSDPQFRQRMQDLGVRIISPSNAVRNGTTEITGVARTSYSMADLQIVNGTDDWLALDFSQSYLVPANINSRSQRLGLVSALEQSGSRSSSPAAGPTPAKTSTKEASGNADLPVVFLRVGLRSTEMPFARTRNTQPSNLNSLRESPESEAWAIKHWVIVSPRSQSVIPFNTVCLDQSRGIPRQDEKFKLSDRPLPLKVQQILEGASLAGEVPQGRVWKTINDEQIKWYDPRVPTSIPTFDLAMMPSLLKDFDAHFDGSSNSVIETRFAQGTRKVQQQDLRGALFEFQQAYQLAPDSLAINFNLSLLYESQYQLISAIRHARTYLQYAPEALDRSEVESRIADLEDDLARHPRAQQTPSQCQDIFDWARNEQQVAKRAGNVGRRQAIMEILITSQKGDCENSRILTASYRQRYQ